VEAPAAPPIVVHLPAPAPEASPLPFLSPATLSTLASSVGGEHASSPVDLAAASLDSSAHGALDASNAPALFTRGGGDNFPVAVLAPAAGAAAGDGLVILHGMGDQAVQASGDGEFVVPADAFAHADPTAAIRLSAQQADGQPLPAWLAFDARTGRFVAHAPRGVDGEVAVRLVARDARGHEVSTVFKIRIGRIGRDGMHAASAQPSGRPGLSEQLRQAGQRPGSAALQRLAQARHEGKETSWPNA
jgi:hypothetical protein